MHVDDCASAIAYLMERVDSEFFANSGLAADGWCHINVGSGQEVSISELAKTISNAVGFQGALNFDASKPDGTLRKLMDNSILRKSGWSPSVDLEAGIKQTVRWYLENIKNIRQ
jgi:GDP-L-fucose synthase